MRALLSLGVVSAIICFGCVSPSSGSRALDDSFVYQPSRFPNGDWQPVGLTFEDAYFQADDGTQLHGWYCPTAQPRAIVLIAHGNAGNLTHRQQRLQLLQRELRVSVMIFDYRGYGRSEGTPSEAGVLSDARAARRWLAQRAGVAERDIVMMGESLGGGVAVDLAAKDGAAGLILESTFTSLPDVASRLLPYTPVRYMMRNRFDSLAKIKDYHGPLLVAHGDADELIPIEQARRLFEAAPGPKWFVSIPGAGHNWNVTEDYVRQLHRFFENIKATRPQLARRGARFEAPPATSH